MATAILSETPHPKAREWRTLLEAEGYKFNFIDSDDLERGKYYLIDMTFPRLHPYGFANVIAGPFESIEALHACSPSKPHGLVWKIICHIHGPEQLA